MENLKTLLMDVINYPSMENKKHLINNFKMFLVNKYDKEDRNQVAFILAVMNVLEQTL